MPDSIKSHPAGFAALLPAAAGVLVILVLLFIMSRWVGQSAAPNTLEAFITLATSLPFPLLWLGAAAGLGWPLRRWLARDAFSPAALQLALGVAMMLMLDAALGAMGLLTNQLIAWLVIVGGLLMFIAQLRRLRHISLEGVSPHWLAWTSAPSVAVLLIAAASAPGWLWTSEFGGYDALSYHLQLPKEWMALGRIQPLDHNVYSFLPGYVEAAYTHMMSLHGHAHAMDSLYDCQMLHVLLTLYVAVMIGLLVSQMIGIRGRAFGAFAAALFLVTPWSVVVGSLAYNEMPVNLMLAAGLIAAMDDRISPSRRGVIIGIVSAAATGAKLTSIGFVAAPLGMVLLMRTSLRAWLPTMSLAAAAGAIGLLPYLIRNLAHDGNPVFPFATSWLGAAHWSAEQTLAWRRGHMPDATLMHRIVALWQQLFVYGYGPNPKPGEPWLPQWGALPWLGVLGGSLALIRKSLRPNVIVLLLVSLAQIAFWIAFTHLQSRFLLPASVPMCALAALGASAMGVRSSNLSMNGASRTARLTLGILALALSLLPVMIYQREGNGAPALAIGTVAMQTGAALDDAGRRELGATALPPVAVNWLLPVSSRVLMVGESAPLYYDLDRISYATVWDRGPLSQILHDLPDDPEQLRIALQSIGFTHVLMNPTMLDIWRRDGWSDPRLAPRNVQELLESAGEPVFDYSRPSQITIYALPSKP